VVRGVVVGGEWVDGWGVLDWGGVGGGDGGDAGGVGGAGGGAMKSTVA